MRKLMKRLRCLLYGHLISEFNEVTFLKIPATPPHTPLVKITSRCLRCRKVLAVNYGSDWGFMHRE